MAKIDQNRLDTIKSLSLLDWIEHEGHTPKKEGADYVMQCPFHQDKTPSLKISPHKNLFHCFGCDAGGTLIDWVQQTQTLEFREAVEYIERQQGSIAIQSQTPIESSSLAAELKNGNEQAALNSAVDYYHACLKQTPEALAYLDSRGLNNDELINTFKLGFSNKTLSSTLAAKHTNIGKQQRKILQACGILKPSGYEHLAGCITIPSLNANGDAVEIYGRRIQVHSTPKHLYLPGPHVQVWNESGFNNTDTLILCEALLDAMTFWVHGFKHVTASYGTNGFTDQHLDLIKQHSISKLLIAYDRDKAGDNAAKALSNHLSKHGIACYRVNFPKGMDANDFGVKMQPAAKALQLVLDKSELLNDVPIINTELPEPLALVAQAIPEQTDTPITQQETLIVTDTDITITYGGRFYRVRGLNNKPDQLKINLLLKYQDNHYVDTLDLYQAKARNHFINQASNELNLNEATIKTDLGKLLLALEDHQEKTHRGDTKTNATPALTLAQSKEALELLTDPHLIQRITNDLNALGLIGEDSNALVSYLSCVSRKLDKPLAVMIQSTSAAGKSMLMDSVLKLMPNDDQHQYAAMTGQSLYYMGEQDLKYKILAISEEEGAHNASYALKLLQSEGEVSIASTGKNEASGELETKTYSVEGPVMLMLTTTAIDIDEELLNRCLVLTVNESRAQTQAIHAMQRKKRTLEGLKQKHHRQTITDQHHAAQQLLKPLTVINPYAEQLTFLSDKTRTRRDHEKYLTLIDSIALLHQCQREIKTESGIDYIEVTLNDIETANQLAHEVLGRSLDELPPQTRKLLNLISEMVQQRCAKESMSQNDYRFSRKQIREYTGWGNTQLKLHCRRLEDMEYLLTHRGKRGQSYEYELLYDASQTHEDKHLPGLIDSHNMQTLSINQNKSGLTHHPSGQKQKKSPPSRGQVGEQSAPSRPTKTSETLSKTTTNPKQVTKPKKTPIIKNKKPAKLNGCIEGLPV